MEVKYICLLFNKKGSSYLSFDGVWPRSIHLMVCGWRKCLPFCSPDHCTFESDNVFSTCISYHIDILLVFSNRMKFIIHIVSCYFVAFCCIITIEMKYIFLETHPCCLQWLVCLVNVCKILWNWRCDGNILALYFPLDFTHNIQDYTVVYTKHIIQTLICQTLFINMHTLK